MSFNYSNLYLILISKPYLVLTVRSNLTLHMSPLQGHIVYVYRPVESIPPVELKSLDVCTM